ncbi:MAG: CPBP family glutamic-type intramembrane protease, partial [Candidatus Omnitrophota bacterium]
MAGREEKTKDNSLFRSSLEAGASQLQAGLLNGLSNPLKGTSSYKDSRVARGTVASPSVAPVATFNNEVESFQATVGSAENLHNRIILEGDTVSSSMAAIKAAPEVSIKGRILSELHFWLSSWKIVLHLGLLFAATKIVVVLGLENTLFHIFAPALLVMMGIFFLWKDISAYKEGRPAELLYVYAAKNVPFSRYLAIQRVFSEAQQKKDDAMSGSFADYGMIKTVSRIITHPVTTVMFVAAFAMIAATAETFTRTDVVIGALLGLFAPYLLNILWNFFWSYMVKADSRQKLLRDYTMYKSGKAKFSLKQNRILSQIDSAEKEIEASGIASGFLQQTLAYYLMMSSIFPALSGILEFALTRLQLFFWGYVFAEAIIPVILPALADQSLLSLFKLGEWHMFATKWHLPYTYGGLAKIAIIVMMLKSFSLRVVNLRNQVQSVFARRKPGKLDVRAVFADFDKFTDVQKAQVKRLVKKQLINSWGRPELTVLLARKLSVEKKSFSVIGYFWYYLIPASIALIITLSAPLAGLLYPVYFVLTHLSRNFSKAHPYFTLWSLKGKEFWASFWHMWIIGAEIGAVIGSGHYLSKHQYLKDFGGKELAGIADSLEGPYGAISWGSHIFNLVSPSATLTQSVHDFLAGDSRINIAERISQARLALEINAIRDSDNFAQELEALAELRSIYWAEMSAADRERVFGGLNAEKRELVENAIEEILDLDLSEYELEAIRQVASYNRLSLDSLYIRKQITGEIPLEQPRYLQEFNKQLGPLFAPWLARNAVEPTAKQEEIIEGVSDELRDFINNYGAKFNKLDVVAVPKNLLGVFYKYVPGFALADLEKVFISQKAKEINRKVLVHQGLHMNTSGFSAHRLDEGMTEYIVEKLIPDYKSQVYAVEVSLINSIIDAISKRIDVGDSATRRSAAENLLIKVYITGDATPLETAIGKGKWGRIVKEAARFDDFVALDKLSQKTLMETYGAGIQKILNERKRNLTLIDIIALSIVAAWAILYALPGYLRRRNDMKALNSKLAEERMSNVGAESDFVFVPAAASAASVDVKTQKLLTKESKINLASKQLTAQTRAPPKQQRTSKNFGIIAKITIVVLTIIFLRAAIVVGGFDGISVGVAGLILLWGGIILSNIHRVKEQKHPIVATLLTLNTLGAFLVGIANIAAAGLVLGGNHIAISSLSYAYFAAQFFVVFMAIVGNYFVWKNYTSADKTQQPRQSRHILRQTVLWSILLIGFTAAVYLAAAYFGMPLYAKPNTNMLAKYVPSFLSMVTKYVPLILSVVAVIPAVIIIPIWEEFAFRGGLYNLFKKLTKGTAGKVTAIITVAFIFALSHYPKLQLAALATNTLFVYLALLFVLGLATTLVYEITGSIIAPIMVHMFYNGYVAAMGLLLGKMPEVAALVLWESIFAAIAVAILSLGIIVIKHFRAQAKAEKIELNNKFNKQLDVANNQSISALALAASPAAKINMPESVRTQEPLLSSQPTRAPPQATGFWKSSWKVILHLGLVIGATQLALRAGAAFTLFYAFVPSLLVMIGIFLLWMDYKAWQNVYPAKLLYVYNSSKLSASEVIALKRFNAERIAADYLKKNGGFSDEGIIGFVSNVFKHPLTALVFTVTGAVIAATGAEFAVANVITGAVLGFLMPYLFNILWNFFWSYMVNDAALQKSAKNYSEGRFSQADSKKLDAIVKQVKAELENTENFSGKAQYFLQAKLAKATIAFPALTGVVKFFLGRLQLVLWGSVIAAALEPFIGAYAAISLLGWGEVAGFAQSWGLPFTLGGLFRIAVIVLGLKLVGQGFTTFRNQIQNALRGAVALSLDAETLFKELSSGKLNVKKASELFRKGLINFNGKPGLRGLIRKQLEVNGAKVTNGWLRQRLLAQTNTYLIPDIVAVLLTIVSPFSGLLYLFHTVTKVLSADFLKKHPVYTLALSRGKQFWVSFWHMWIIGAEIGAVIKSGDFFAEHPYLKYVGGKELGQIAQYLEGKDGAISWGGHALGVINHGLGFNLSQVMHNALGGSTDVSAWEIEYQSKINFDIIRNSAQYKNSVKSIEGEVRMKHEKLIKDMPADELSRIVETATMHVYSQMNTSWKPEADKYDAALQSVIISLILRQYESRKAKPESKGLKVLIEAAFSEIQETAERISSEFENMAAAAKKLLAKVKSEWDNRVIAVKDAQKKTQAEEACLDFEKLKREAMEYGEQQKKKFANQPQPVMTIAPRELPLERQKAVLPVIRPLPEELKVKVTPQLPEPLLPLRRSFEETDKKVNIPAVKLPKQNTVEFPVELVPGLLPEGIELLKNIEDANDAIAKADAAFKVALAAKEAARAVYEPLAAEVLRLGRELKIAENSLGKLVRQKPEPKKLILADFGADWCPGCRAVAPKVEALAVKEEFKDILEIRQINVDKNPDLMRKYEIGPIPALLLYEGDKKLDTKIGDQTAEVLEQWINDNAGSVRANAKLIKDINDKIAKVEKNISGLKGLLEVAVEKEKTAAAELDKANVAFTSADAAKRNAQAVLRIEKQKAEMASVKPTVGKDDTVLQRLAQDMPILPRREIESQPLVRKPVVLPPLPLRFSLPQFKLSEFSVDVPLQLLSPVEYQRTMQPAEATPIEVDGLKTADTTKGEESTEEIAGLKAEAAKVSQEAEGLGSLTTEISVILERAVKTVKDAKTIEDAEQRRQQIDKAFSDISLAKTQAAIAVKRSAAVEEAVKALIAKVKPQENQEARLTVSGIEEQSTAVRAKIARMLKAISTVNRQIDEAYNMATPKGKAVREANAFVLSHIKEIIKSQKFKTPAAAIAALETAARSDDDIEVRQRALDASTDKDYIDALRVIIIESKKVNPWALYALRTAVVRNSKQATEALEKIIQQLPEEYVVAMAATVLGKDSKINKLSVAAEALAKAAKNSKDNETAENAQAALKEIIASLRPRVDEHEKVKTALFELLVYVSGQGSQNAARLLVKFLANPENEDIVLDASYDFRYGKDTARVQAFVRALLIESRLQDLSSEAKRSLSELIRNGLDALIWAGRKDLIIELSRDNKIPAYWRRIITITYAEVEENQRYAIAEELANDIANMSYSERDIKIAFEESLYAENVIAVSRAILLRQRFTGLNEQTEEILMSSLGAVYRKSKPELIKALSKDNRIDAGWRAFIASLPEALKEKGWRWPERIPAVYLSDMVAGNIEEGKKIIMINAPVYDWNLAFGQLRNVINIFKSHGWNVIYNEAATTDELIASTARIAEQYHRKANAIMLVGHSHGDEEPGFRLSEGTEENRWVGFKDEKKLEAIAAYLVQDGTGAAFVVSCSSGNNGVVDMVSRSLKKANLKFVGGPRVASNIDDIVFNADNNISSAKWQVTGSEYNAVGTDDEDNTISEARERVDRQIAKEGRQKAEKNQQEVLTELSRAKDVKQVEAAVKKASDALVKAYPDLYTAVVERAQMRKTEIKILALKQEAKEVERFGRELSAKVDEVIKSLKTAQLTAMPLKQPKGDKEIGSSDTVKSIRGDTSSGKQPLDSASGNRSMSDNEGAIFRQYLAGNFSRAKNISTAANVQAALQAAIDYAKTHNFPQHAQYLEEVRAKGLIRAMPLNGWANQPEDLVIYATVYAEGNIRYIVEDTDFLNTADTIVRVAKYLHEAGAAINNKATDKENRATEYRFYEDSYKDIFDEKALALIERTKSKSVSETVKDKKGNDWLFVDGRPMFMRSALVTHTAPGELPHKKGVKHVNPNIYWQFIDRDRNGKPDAMELFIDKDGDGKFTEGVDERTTVFELARKYGFNTLTIFGDIINHELFPKEYFNANSPIRFTVA